MPPRSSARRVLRPLPTPRNRRGEAIAERHSAIDTTTPPCKRRHGSAGAPRALGGAISGPHHLRRLSRRATALPGRDERWGGWGAISGPHHLRRLSRRATALPGRDERWGGWGAISGPHPLRRRSRRAAALPGRGGRGGFGGPSRGPITCDGYRGAPRLCRGATSAGGLGGHLGAHHLRRLSRRATALPGRDERWGGWGAISGPPIYIDTTTPPCENGPNSPTFRRRRTPTDDADVTRTIRARLGRRPSVHAGLQRVPGRASRSPARSRAEAARRPRAAARRRPRRAPPGAAAPERGDHGRLEGAAGPRRAAEARDRDLGTVLDHLDVHQRAEPRPRGRARGGRPRRRRGLGRPPADRHRARGRQPAGRGEP